jgi:hypothetical protein
MSKTQPDFEFNGRFWLSRNPSNFLRGTLREQTASVWCAVRAVPFPSERPSGMVMGGLQKGLMASRRMIDCTRTVMVSLPSVTDFSPRFAGKLWRDLPVPRSPPSSPPVSKKSRHNHDTEDALIQTTGFMSAESTQHSMIAAPVNQSAGFTEPVESALAPPGDRSTGFRESGDCLHASEHEDSQNTTIVDCARDLEQRRWAEQLTTDPCLRLKAAAYRGDTPHTHAKFVSVKQAMRMGLQDPETMCAVLEQCFSMLSCKEQPQGDHEKLKQDHRQEVEALREEHKQGSSTLRKDHKQACEKLKEQSAKKLVSEKKAQERALEDLQRKHKHDLEQAMCAVRVKVVEQTATEIKHARMCEQVLMAHQLLVSTESMDQSARTQVKHLFDNLAGAILTSRLSTTGLALLHMADTCHNLNKDGSSGIRFCDQVMAAFHAASQKKQYTYSMNASSKKMFEAWHR